MENTSDSSLSTKQKSKFDYFLTIFYNIFIYLLLYFIYTYKLSKGKLG